MGSISDSTDVHDNIRESMTLSEYNLEGRRTVPLDVAQRGIEVSYTGTRHTQDLENLYTNASTNDQDIFSDPV